MRKQAFARAPWNWIFLNAHRFRRSHGPAAERQTSKSDAAGRRRRAAPLGEPAHLRRSSEHFLAAITSARGEHCPFRSRLTTTCEPQACQRNWDGLLISV